MYRAINLYLFMLREWADDKQRNEIDRALRPPLTWRDPRTGLPADWGDEADEWAEWERAARR